MFSDKKVHFIVSVDSPGRELTMGPRGWILLLLAARASVGKTQMLGRLRLTGDRPEPSRPGLEAEGQLHSQVRSPELG